MTINDFDVVREVFSFSYQDNESRQQFDEALARIEADNAELHAIAEQATMRGEQALAERDRYKAGLRHQVPGNGSIMDVPCEDYEAYVVAERDRYKAAVAAVVTAYERGEIDYTHDNGIAALTRVYLALDGSNHEV
jgi:hypothetical protein